MQRFIASDAWAEITLAARESVGPALIASAYFSEIGDKMLPVSSGSILVVDATERCVRAGMTSPFSLRRMKDRGVGVYSALNLHSKTYIFDNNLTIVGSCNVSTGSRDRLIEAAIMTNNPKVCRDAGQFIRSIAVNPLSDSDLDDLCKIYEPPKLTKLTRGQMRGQALVMELNQEQGGAGHHKFSRPELSGKAILELTG